ncbi:response regulator transcription factor [Micromonospora sp. HM5-17]|jgi:two-component system response regulator DesR|uniref:response regulator transcription factor n=1 Tax=Micromonospora sp. HM5-17 TaxID=2487710 RepID=UPI000F471643|nr:response regulator transcription factor [Micromonospora sp. HM5-17]ROT29769.1 DNA-binding response regulator [Micromonospora sp. HM5-17]
MIRVVIVEEMGLLRRALCAMLSREDDLEVVADLQEPDGLVPVARARRPDVVVVDMDRPDTLAAVARLGAEVPESAVLTLSSQPSPEMLQRALRAGARGFVTKNLPPTELTRLVRAVAAGERVVDPVAAVAALTPSAGPLTEREREVLRIVAEGLPLKEIARRLFLAHGTVRNHLSVILRKTGSRNRLEAVRRAQRAGWL